MAKDRKIIAIGGVTGGIGRELANRLKGSGHTLFGYARTADDVDGVDVKECDATDPEALDSFFESVHEAEGRIDAYVHAVGSIYIKPAHMTPDKDWHDTINRNLNTAFFALRSATKRMQKQDDGGSLLFFSTAAAHRGIANHEAIAAAKGGIDAMLRSAAATYASRGLRINAIAPSLTDTPLSEPITGNEKALELSKQMHPLGDITRKEDVASLAEWLISDHAKFVTGQTYLMDGGLSAIVPKPRA